MIDLDERRFAFFSRSLPFHVVWLPTQTTFKRGWGTN